MFSANTYITSVYEKKTNYFSFFFLFALVSLSSLAVLRVRKRLCTIFYLCTYSLIRRKPRDCILCNIKYFQVHLRRCIVCAPAASISHLTSETCDVARAPFFVPFRCLKTSQSRLMCATNKSSKSKIRNEKRTAYISQIKRWNRRNRRTLLRFGRISFITKTYSDEPVCNSFSNLRASVCNGGTQRS